MYTPLELALGNLAVSQVTFSSDLHIKLAFFETFFSYLHIK